MANDLIARIEERIAKIDVVTKDCREELGDDYGKPNFIEDDGSETWVPCEHCLERMRDRELFVEAIALLRGGA